MQRLRNFGPTLLEQAPLAVNIILVALLAYGATRYAQDLANNGHSDATMAVPVVVKERPKQLLPPMPVSQIASLHLFGTVAAKKTVKQPITKKAPETKLNLTLRGILASDDVSTQLAIIQDNDKRKEQHFAIGDTLFDLATLEEIHVDRVIISRNGRYETLRLPKDRLKGIGRADTAARAAPRQQVTSEEYVQFMEEQMREIHKSTLKSERNPWRYIYYEPAMENGRIVGLKLAAEEEKEFLASHGLQLGDVITSINGTAVNVGGGMVKALDLVSETDKLEFVINRNGKEKKITVSNK